MTGDLVQRRLAAIVAADMVGYSRLMQLDEAGTVARQKACLNEVVFPRLKEFGGRLVKTTGDGVLVEFPSAVGAVMCAVAVQRDMAAREADVDPDRRIAYRIGINVGEIIHDGGDIFGDGVNVAARLEALAEPGGIRISDTVFNNVQGKLDLGFADLGPRKVKNIAEPVANYRVLLDPADAGRFIAAAPNRIRRPLAWIGGAMLVLLLALAGYFLRDGLGAGDDPAATRVLIIPYQADDRDAGLLADAVSENLWLTMARLKGITVVPRKAALTLKGLDPSPDQIAAQGPVTHVLGGAVTTTGGEVVVSSRLRRVNGEVIWERQSTTPQAELFKGLARQKVEVAAALKLPLNARERDILEGTFTENPEAFLLFAQAEQLFETRHWNAMHPAMALYEQAYAIDDGFLAARAGYASANYLIWLQSWSVARNTLEARTAAEQAVEEILARDPVNPDALSIKINIKMNSLEQEQALTMARGAVFQNAAAPELRYTLGYALLANALYDEARDEFDRYVEQSARLSKFDTVNLAHAYSALGDPARALSLLSTVEREGPGYESVDWSFTEAYARTGDLEAAKQSFRNVLKGWPAANVMWAKLRFGVFKDPSVFETYSAAMQSAGMPVWPYDFDRTHAADRLDNAALTALFSPGFTAVDGTDELGGKLELKVFPDGTVHRRVGFLRDLYQGAWRIVDDAVCFRFPDLFKAQEACEMMFVDRENATPQAPRYIQLNNFGLRKFGARRLDG